MQDERLIRVAREKDKILDLFRQKGMRITKQRRLKGYEGVTEIERVIL